MWGSPRPRLTILDLITFKGEDWFNSLFSQFENTDIIKQTAVDSIMDRCAYSDLRTTDSATFEFSVRAWLSRNVDRYDRLFRSMNLDYDALHNYERWTIYQDKRNLSEDSDGTFSEDSSENSNVNRKSTIQDSANKSNSSESRRSPYSNDNYYPYEQTNGSGTESHTITDTGNDSSNVTGNRSNKNTDSRKLSDDFVHNEFTQGDSGVNTPQDSLEQEWRLREKHNVYDLIAKEFDYTFCLGVY